VFEPQFSSSATVLSSSPGIAVLIFSRGFVPIAGLCDPLADSCNLRKPFEGFGIEFSLLIANNG
jgi:hypothetical protein